MRAYSYQTGFFGLCSIFAIEAAKPLLCLESITANVTKEKKKEKI